MLRRSKWGKSSSNSNSGDTDGSHDSVIPDNSSQNTEPPKKLKSTPNGHNERNTKSRSVDPIASMPQKPSSVEKQLRDALQKNQQMLSRVELMENQFRQIANEAKIIVEDTDKLDTNQISTKLIQFVRNHGIPPPEPFSHEAANSALIAEVFDEIDENDRKYEEQQRGYSTNSFAAKDDGVEFENDVPPKKVRSFRCYLQTVRARETL